MLQSLTSKAPTKPEEWDGNWRLVDYDPVSEISDWYLYDDTNPQKPKIHMRTIQHNVDAMLDANQAEFNAQLGARWGDGKKVATIPTNVAAALGLDDALAAGDRSFVRKVLNNSDYSKLRTFKGNL